MHPCENELFIISHRILRLVEDELAVKSIDHNESKYYDFTEQCNRLCTKYIYSYITSNLHQTGRQHLTIEDLKKSLSISSDYGKFLNYMLDVLALDKMLVIEKHLLKFNSTQPVSWGIEDIKTIYPMFKGTLTLLDHCASYMSLALSEKIPAISVLYPDGCSAFLETTLAEDTAEYSSMPLIRSTAVDLITTLAHKKKNLKILEVGGGRGLFTRDLLKAITGKCKVEYHFTDISKRFIIDMHRYTISEDISNSVACHQFDITKSALEQGLDLNSYDIILGLDVIHATHDVAVSLKNLKQLLKQNGMLCLLETTTAPRWQYIIMGLTKGWWLYNDKWRTSSPLLSTDLWRNCLESCGFRRIYIPKLSNIIIDSALIIATH